MPNESQLKYLRNVAQELVDGWNLDIDDERQRLWDSMSHELRADTNALVAAIFGPWFEGV